MATHATSLLQCAEKVLILSNGRIEHDGTYEQLLRTGAIKDVPETASAKKLSEATQSKDTEMPAIAAHVAAENEKADLRRRVGDLEVYKYYFKSIGLFKLCTFVGFTIIHVFAVTFTCMLNTNFYSLH